MTDKIEYDLDKVARLVAGIKEGLQSTSVTEATKSEVHIAFGNAKQMILGSMEE